MGFFSGEYNTYVGTSVARVVQDSLIPSSVKTGISNAIVTGNDLVLSIVDELTGSVGIRAERMYEFGKNGYLHGLPSATLLSSSSGRAGVESILKTQFGVSTEMLYYEFGPINNIHLGWKLLCEVHSYTSSDNKLGALSIEKGTSVYLKDMRLCVVEATMQERQNGSLEQWGIAPNAGYTPTRAAMPQGLRKTTQYAVDTTATQDFILVSYVWQDSVVTTVDGVAVTKLTNREDSFQLFLAGYDRVPDYFQAKYTVNGNAGYWLHQNGVGTFPAVEGLFTTHQSTFGTYFPFGYLRYGYSAEPSAEERATQTKLLKHIGMDFDSVAESIAENPDIKDVESALLMMAVPANSTNPIEQRYLFDFFNRLYAESGSDVLTHNGLYYDVPKISLVIEDKQFKTALSCNAITKRMVAGSIGMVGSHSSEVTYKEISLVTANVQNGEYASGAETTTWFATVSMHSYRHQVSGNYYEEIQVSDLKMTYFIYGDYNAIGDEEDTILLIPLDYSITSEYSIPDKEILYSRSLHYIFNSRVTVYTRWYQTTFFQFVLLAVAVVMVVSGNIQAIGLLQTAAAVGIATFAFTLVTAILLPLLVTYFEFKLLVKVVGIKAASILTLLWYGYKGIQAEGLSGAPFAREMVNLASNLSRVISNYYQADFEKLLEDVARYSKDMETEQKLIDDARDLLNSTVSRLNPYLIWGETPDEFYERTVHSGNIGITGIEALSSFVGVALALPTIASSLDRNMYEFA